MTIIEQPGTIVSAYDPLIIEVFDNAATSTATMVAVVQVQRNLDGRWIDLSSKTQFKYRNSPYFKFDVSDILKNEVTFDYPNRSGSKIIIENNDSVIWARVKVTHYESGVMQSSAYSDQFAATNTILPKGETFADYTLVDVETKSFLTQNKTQRLRPGEHLQFHFLWDEGQIATDAQLKKYPLSGSPTTSSIDILPYDYRIAAFQGFDGDTLTSTPTLLYTNSELTRITGSDGKEYVGVEIDPSSKYVEIPTSAIGKNFIYEVFMQEAGNVLVTWVNGTGVDIYAAPIGYSTQDAGTIPASTTHIRVENKTSSTMWLVWADTYTADEEDMQMKRGILYVDEYDATLEKIELWIENDGDQITETLTVFMDGCSNSKRLAWLSKTGTMEHYTFTWNDQTQRTVEKNKIETEVSDNYSEERGTITLNAQSNDVTTVYTRYESNEVIAWLSDIIESPEVYLVNSHNDRIPVDVTSSSFPSGGKQLQQGTVSFRRSNNHRVQNG